MYKKKKDSSPRGCLVVFCVFVLIIAIAVAGVLGALYLWSTGRWQPNDKLKQMLMNMVDSTELMGYARSLEDDLGALSVDIREQDVPGAEASEKLVRADIDGIRDYLDRPFFRIASKSPGLSKEVDTVRTLLDILDDADRELILPYIDQMRDNPISEMSGPDGVHVHALLDYMDFLEYALPRADRLIGDLRGADLSLIDEKGEIEGYIKNLDELLATGKAALEFLPPLRVLLGDGRDRLYVFAAQNSSEIRASGGFPGSVGTVRIRDGLLTVTDFQSVYNVFQASTPEAANVSYVEDKLFSGRMHLSWDSDFSPDFERVATIWALAYEARNGEPVDGVISATPAVIQRLLRFLGTITLSDGTVLNGFNACRILGRDLYFRYLGADTQPGAESAVDALFAEAARETMSRLFSRADLSTAIETFGLFRECVADRTLMFWMADENEQAEMRRVGWAAGLNQDPLHPQAGVFFNSTAASKISWFLNINPELSEPTVNSDGSLSYRLTVTFSNVITSEEIAAASSYILGGTGGITGSFYIFAPAGGHIDSAGTMYGVDDMQREVYEGLEVAYLTDMTITDSPLVLVCLITTAPGVEAPMGLMVTPTMQDYRF